MNARSKTSYFDKIRSLYANKFGEYWLLKFVQGKNASDFAARFIPMPHLFPNPSWRQVYRNDLRLNLDISDLVDWYIYFNLKEEGLDLMLSFIQPGDLVLDIGTNVGYFALRCAMKAKRGFVYGFEPSEISFNKCQANLGLNNLSNLVVEQLALGEMEGTAYLHTETENNRGMNRISTDRISEDEQIKVRSMDQFVKENNISKVNFIKLDVEGYEMQVLKGGEQTISAFRPKLFLEVDDTLLGRFGVSSTSIFHWLQEREYNIYDIRGNRLHDVTGIFDRHVDVIAIPSESDRSLL